MKKTISQLMKELADGQETSINRADDILAMIRKRQKETGQPDPAKWSLYPGMHWKLNHIKGILIGMDLSMPAEEEGQTWEPWMLPNLKRDLAYLYDTLDQWMVEERNKHEQK